MFMSAVIVLCNVISVALSKLVSDNRKAVLWQGKPRDAIAAHLSSTDSKLTYFATDKCLGHTAT